MLTILFLLSGRFSLTFLLTLYYSLETNLPFFVNLITNFLLILVLSCALLTFLNDNTVYSILFLILTFLFSALLLFLLQCDFLAFIFLIIYVGAVAILFLFVISLLDIENFTIISSLKNDIPILLIFFLVFIFEILYSFFNFFEIDLSTLLVLNFLPTTYYLDWLNINESFTNINLFGCVLYSKFFLFVLISGFILLIAILGSVALTTTFNNNYNNKSQLLFKQISRKI